jgi:hypothetical protein
VEFDKLKIDAQRLDKTSFALAESLKLILSSNSLPFQLAAP